MRTFVLLFLFLLTTGDAAMAGWVRIAHNEQTVFFLESPLPKKAGNSLVLWLLRDHATPRSGPAGTYLSSRDQIEVDCTGRRIRRLYSSDHPQAMGAGPLVHFEHGPMSWNQAPPQTIAGRMVAIACL